MGSAPRRECGAARRQNSKFLTGLFAFGVVQGQGEAPLGKEGRTRVEEQFDFF